VLRFLWRAKGHHAEAQRRLMELLSFTNDNRRETAEILARHNFPYRETTVAARKKKPR
jgi:hypothetical protein